MINALFSSKENGTKAFELDGIEFGWKSICSMYERECNRVSSGLTRMVPKLKEVHIIRDAWTKLNVSPAGLSPIKFCVCACAYITYNIYIVNCKCMYIIMLLL